MEKKRALVIDDLKSHRKTVGIILEKLGYQVLESSTIQEMRKHLLVGDIHIAIADINIFQEGGGMINGIDVAHMLKNIFHIPVIVCSAAVDGNRVSKAYELGITNIIAKPATAAVLQHKIRRAIAEHGENNG